MKSVVSVSIHKDAEIYPCLKEHTERPFVVLFTTPFEGVVIASDYDKAPVGLYSKEWIDKMFKKFEHQVILSN